MKKVYCVHFLNEATHSGKYTFEGLKNYFEPGKKLILDSSESRKEWEEIKDFQDLLSFVSRAYYGEKLPYIEEITIEE